MQGGRSSQPLQPSAWLGARAAVRVTAVEHQDPRLLHQSMDAMELWGNKFDSAACLAWIPALHYLKLDIAVQEVDGAYACVRC